MVQASLLVAPGMMSELKCESSQRNGVLDEHDGTRGRSSAWIGTFLNSSLIVDIRRSRRFPSKDKCKIINADKRVIKKLKVQKLSISKQPVICVKPSLYASTVEAKMFKEEDSGCEKSEVSEVK